MAWEMGREMLYLDVAFYELLSKHNHPECDLKTEMEQMKAGMTEAAAADNINTLMGIEGNAARRYFSGFAKMMLGPFTFEGRRNTTLRKCFRFQAEKLASCIKGGEPYTTFNLEV